MCVRGAMSYLVGHKEEILFGSESDHILNALPALNLAWKRYRGV